MGKGQTNGTRCCAMTKIRLRYVQAFTARGKPYYYFRKPGCARIKLPGLPGSAEFMDAYQAALAASAPPSTINISERMFPIGTAELAWINDNIASAWPWVERIRARGSTGSDCKIRGCRQSPPARTFRCNERNGPY